MLQSVTSKILLLNRELNIICISINKINLNLITNIQYRNSYSTQSVKTLFNYNGILLDSSRYEKVLRYRQT